MNTFWKSLDSPHLPVYVIVYISDSDNLYIEIDKYMLWFICEYILDFVLDESYFTKNAFC